MHVLIGLHAGIGEMGALMFLWVLVEMLNPAPDRIRRAKIAAAIGVLFLVLSWIIGGYYYLGDYQTGVKNLIKTGPAPWAHLVITETKEHVFMFLPFMGILAWGMLARYAEDLLDSRRDVARAVALLSLMIVLVGFAMAGMGYLISSGMRSALEYKLL